MAEEDLIFGKNRHLFGGIEPSNMRKFQVLNRSTGVKIFLTLPKSTVVDGQTLCTIAGVEIRKSTDGYPKDEFSGTKVVTILFDGVTYDYETVDTKVESNVTYYYSAFPYTTQGVYNRNAALENSPNRDTITYGVLKCGYLYGYDLDLDDSNPETRVSYPSDVDNYGWYNAKSNISGTNYGLSGLNLSIGWGKVVQPGVDFTPRPCMLNFDGTVAEYLDPYNYGKTIDGKNSKLNFQDNETSNAMMEWPKIFIKREVVDGIYKFRCSDVPIDDDWDCWCNYDRHGNEIDHFYTAIYPLTSNEGQTSCTYVNAKCLPRSLRDCQYLYLDDHIDDIIDFVRVQNGIDWDIEQLCDRLLINDLLVMIGKSTDVQSKFGNGIVASESKPTHSWDRTDDGADIHNYGLFYGTTDNNTSMVKIFGMINWYGCRYKVVAGLFAMIRSCYIKLTRSTHDGSNTDDYKYGNNNMIKFKDYSNVFGYDAYAEGYVNETFNFVGGRLPIGVEGSSTTYETDKFTKAHTQQGVPLFGGCHSTPGGPFELSLCTDASMDKWYYADNSSTNVNIRTTTSLSCKPSKVE